MRDLFTVIAVSGGVLLYVAGTAGLLRFPDTLSRLHALTKVDNLGLGLVVLGLMPQTGFLTAVKLLVLWLIVQLSGAIVTQVLAGSVSGTEPPQ